MKVKSRVNFNNLTALVDTMRSKAPLLTIFAIFFMLIHRTAFAFPTRTTVFRRVSSSSKFVFYAAASEEPVATRSLLTVLRKLQSNPQITDKNRDGFDGDNEEDRDNLKTDVAAVIMSWRPEELTVTIDEIAELCSCLAEAGISSADLGIDAWKVVDTMVSSIRAEILSNRNEAMGTKQRRYYESSVDKYGPNEDDDIVLHHSNSIRNNSDNIGISSTSSVTSSSSSRSNNNSNKNSRSVANDVNGSSFMELLRGLQGMQVRWRTLGASARGNLDHMIHQHLTTTMASDEDLDGEGDGGARAKVDIFTLIVVLGHLKLAYSDLSPCTRQALSDATVYCATNLPAHSAIADLLYAMGSMGVVWADLPPPTQHRLKSLVVKYLPRPAQRGRAWRGLFGLAEMGWRWPSGDVKLRGALEGCLQQYAVVRTWAYSPKVGG